jgi:hypothetical protein
MERRKTEFGWERREVKDYKPGQHKYRPLTENEEKQRTLMMTAALDMAGKVGLVNEEAAYLTPDQLDLAWERVNPAPANELEMLFASYLFGFPLGEFLVQTNGMHWCMFSDEEGSSLAVHHERADVTAFPIASVRKRLMPNDPPFFKAVISTVVKQISASLVARQEFEAEEAKRAAKQKK